jgi:hypothetical protein
MSESRLPVAPPTMSPPVEGHYDLLDFKTLDNPDSVVNRLPSWLGALIMAIPDDVFDMTYESLRKQAKPTSVEERLRHSFWNEYKRVIHDVRKPNISVNNVIGGVCSLNGFKKIAAFSYKLAYILQPPPSVDLAFDELIHKGLAEMMLIMATPMVDDKGKVDSKLGALKSKILNDVLTRRNGNVAQNVNIRQQVQSQHQHQVLMQPPQPSQDAQLLDVIQPVIPQPLTTLEVEAMLEAEGNYENKV